MPKLWRAPIPMVRIMPPQITGIQKSVRRGMAILSQPRCCDAGKSAYTRICADVNRSIHAAIWEPAGIVCGWDRRGTAPPSARARPILAAAENQQAALDAQQIGAQQNDVPRIG